jgi:hypothetical protein
MDVFRDANNNNNDNYELLSQTSGQQQNWGFNALQPGEDSVCQCPKMRKEACFSSLCCEMCKLFPTPNRQEQEKQQQLPINTNWNFTAATNLATTSSMGGHKNEKVLKNYNEVFLQPKNDNVLQSPKR